MAGLAHAREKFSFDPRKSQRGTVWAWMRIGFRSIVLTGVLCSAVAIDAIREAVTVMAEPAIGGAQAAAPAHIDHSTLREINPTPRRTGRRKLVVQQI